MRLLGGYLRVGLIAFLYAWLTGRVVLTQFRFNFDGWFWYLLLVGGFIYPWTLTAERRFLERLRPFFHWGPTAAGKRHAQDLISQDRGSNWRVPHSQVSYAGMEGGVDVFAGMAATTVNIAVHLVWLGLCPLILAGLWLMRSTKKRSR